jgi:tetratricopeptide (TPR) repeat protein
MKIDDELVKQATRLVKQGEKESARSLLKRALKINPQNEKAWVAIASTTDKLILRLRYLRQAKKINPTNPSIQAEILDIQRMIGERGKTIWSKTNILRTALAFLLFSLIPFIWLLFKDIIPTLTRNSTKMSGEWNVAVAGFTSQGTDLNNPDVKLIGTIFSNRFSQEMESLGSNANLIVQVRGSEQVQSITGNGIDERATNAAKLAEKINADMLIYGTIRQVDGGYVLQPEFYIRARNYYEADELFGQHSFGGPISIIASRNTFPSQVHLNIELTRRSEILAFVARGLSLYLVQSYEQASQMFEQANQDQFWQKSEGRELIYLLQGNAEIRLQQFEQAKQAYSLAVQLAPQYGRGYIGLGNVVYLQALETESQQNFNPNRQELSQAEDYFQQALQAIDQPASAEIPSKAAFGLGQIYMTEWFLGEDVHDPAIEQFQIVLDQYADGAKPQLQELASESHSRVAVIYRQDGQLDTALAEFQQALDLSTLPARKGLYYAAVSNLYRQQDDSQRAENASLQAIEQYQIALGLPISNVLKALYWSDIAAQYELLQQKPQAIDAYEQALQLLPADSPDHAGYQQRLEALNH